MTKLSVLDLPIRQTMKGNILSTLQIQIKLAFYLLLIGGFSFIRVYVYSDAYTLGGFEIIPRECVNPFLCAGFTLIPVVQRPVLKVTQGFVCADSEGGRGHGQGEAVQQWCVVVYGGQYPPEQVIKHGQEPEE